mmetsp:Transcript_26445/g.49914  ORF Transcript_26445/g.49914 Transcript_26445/m.49914 type:complete len:348 (+) Transcript_26445:47-1090(+)
MATRSNRQSFTPLMCCIYVTIFVFLVLQYRSGVFNAVASAQRKHSLLDARHEARVEATAEAAKPEQRYQIQPAADLTDSPTRVSAEQQPPPVQVQLAYQEHTEYWGDVVVAGVGKRAVPCKDAQTCAQRCRSTPGCNVWVFCPSQGCASQCWLKWVKDPTKPPVQGEGVHVPWTSGALLKDYDDGLPRPPVDASISHVAIVTRLGDIRVKLRPDWTQSSVDFVREVAQRGLCTPQCAFYRAEPRFLLQGGMRATIPPNSRTTPGPVMGKGMVGWAGGSAGPDFFIYMSENQAVGWHNDHTVWGEVLEQASLELVEEIIATVETEKETPNSMSMISDPIEFTMRAERG